MFKVWNHEQKTCFNKYSREKNVDERDVTSMNPGRMEGF